MTFTANAVAVPERVAANTFPKLPLPSRGPSVYGCSGCSIPARTRYTKSAGHRCEPGVGAGAGTAEAVEPEATVGTAGADCEGTVSVQPKTLKLIAKSATRAQ